MFSCSESRPHMPRSFRLYSAHSIVSPHSLRKIDYIYAFMSSYDLRFISIIYFELYFIKSCSYQVACLGSLDVLFAITRLVKLVNNFYLKLPTLIVITDLS